MDTLFIPTETDFKNWIREAVKESLDVTATQIDKANERTAEPLLSRKEVGSYLNISLVTLNECMKKGLPSHKVNGRVYFQRSEVLEYVKANKRKQ